MLINRHPDDWKETLHAGLADWQSRFPGQQLYALVEGVHNELFYRKLKQAGCFPYVSLYSTAPSADEETLALAPILVEFNAEQPGLWNKLMELTNGLPALCMIGSPESLPQLAARLIPWCVVDADCYTVALSFADTRVLPALVDALTEEQHGQFLGPATRWQYVARDAAWRDLPVRPELARPPAGKVELTASQCAALMAASEPDSMVFQFKRYISNPLDGYTSAEAHGMIRLWLEVADRMRMDGNQDRVALCEFGLAKPELLNDPRYLALLEQGASPRTLDETRAFLS